LENSRVSASSSNPKIDLASAASNESLPDQLPRHIAAIMDGNGRWAQEQGLPRIEGHRRGAKTVRALTEECARLKIEQLTLYCLSSENWKRPPEEVEFLMNLLEQYLISERDTLMENNIALKIIGRRNPLPTKVQMEMDKTMQMTRDNDGTVLCLAINYGSRGEIVDAVKSIGQKIVNGEITVDQIDEEVISDHLYTRSMPDPDLLIRTAGEMRVSNYLLWQISYAEIWITQRFWPEFSISDFHESLRAYAARERRFGGLINATEESDSC
jgi:undecaprenyl diphosphate synthase